MNAYNITGNNSIIINKKSYTNPFNPGLFMLSTATFFEIFSKHNGYGFISASFGMN